MKIKLLALAFTLFTVIANAANCTHEGPEESFLYRYIKKQGQSSPNYYVTDYEAYFEYVQNWSRTSSEPYGSLTQTMTPAGKTVFLFDWAEKIDVYSAGKYTDDFVIDEVSISSYNGNTTTVHDDYPENVDQYAHLTYPDSDSGGGGYQRSYTNVNNNDGFRYTETLSELKRFRINNANTSFSSTVTFTVTANVFNPVTYTTGSAISATSILVNNVSCDSNGHVSFTWTADNTWHDLSVTATGQPNIWYTISWSSNTNPG